MKKTMKTMKKTMKKAIEKTIEKTIDKTMLVITNSTALKGTIRQTIKRKALRTQETIKKPSLGLKVLPFCVT